jgi:hypothetical protein
MAATPLPDRPISLSTALSKAVAKAETSEVRQVPIAPRVSP